ncbi:MAG: DUF1800 family protein, partial [Hyphomonadaceae bacterium]
PSSIAPSPSSCSSRASTTTGNSFAERWLRFWSNHFTVSIRSLLLTGLVGPFEREAIRPHVFGNFSTLLRKATFHQCMLVYLDAAESVGPSTPAAMIRRVGLNENLAREIMELHTLGVGSGYSQADIIEFAKALTGWTVAGIRPNLTMANATTFRQGRRAKAKSTAPVVQIGKTIFAEDLHEPGARLVLSRRYADTGREQAPAVLDDLARSKATATHIATKLARHFVSDHPPSTVIDMLARVFVASGGDLSALARAVVDLDEAWGEEQQKFKTPEELAISTIRVAGPQLSFQGGVGQVNSIYQSLAQTPFRAPSPAGWPDDTASWAGPDAVKKRLEWANAVARRTARVASPSAMLEMSLGELASKRTLDTVARAESAEQGFTLAIMSPEFQRR